VRGAVGPTPLDLGQADVESSGDDVSVFAIGLMARRARKLAARLAQEGIGVEVVDVCSLSPLPWETILESARKTGRVVVADEARKTCSAASEIAAGIAEYAFDDLKAPIARVAVPDVPVPFAPELEVEVIPQEDDILEAVQRVLR
jgi:pyruvate dehydrogenase E1 component beta subunit